MDFYDAEIASVLGKRHNMTDTIVEVLKNELKKCEDKKKFFSTLMNNNIQYLQRHISRNIATLVKLHIADKKVRETLNNKNVDSTRKYVSVKHRILKRMIKSYAQQQDQTLMFDMLYTITVAIANKAKIDRSNSRIVKKQSTIKNAYNRYRHAFTEFNIRMDRMNQDIEGYNNRIKVMLEKKNANDGIAKKMREKIAEKWGHMYQQEEHTCPICIEDGTDMVKTSCGHYYHVECIIQYVHNILLNSFHRDIEIRCPMCRQHF